GQRIARQLDALEAGGPLVPRKGHAERVERCERRLDDLRADAVALNEGGRDRLRGHRPHYSTMRCRAGGLARAALGEAQGTLDSIRRTRLALKGPLATPSGGGYRSSNVRLREELGLYANLRPARTLVPGGRYENIDLV